MYSITKKEYIKKEIEYVILTDIYGNKKIYDNIYFWHHNFFLQHICLFGYDHTISRLISSKMKYNIEEKSVLITPYLSDTRDNKHKNFLIYFTKNGWKRLIKKDYNYIKIHKKMYMKRYYNTESD